MAAAIACGALRRHDGGIGEVKRMYTRPAHQGRGIGGRILEAIEALARTEGISRLVLETGDRHAAAWRVYERGGFARCGAVLDYPDYSGLRQDARHCEDAGIMSNVIPRRVGDTPSA